jgi:succinyl-diaminopimelate desuccinylase
VVLTTKVIGAQHGSVPNENRAQGASPVVSLANFLAHLVDDGTLAPNGVGRMLQFMAWGWGTTVSARSSLTCWNATTRSSSKATGRPTR